MRNVDGAVQGNIATFGAVSKPQAVRGHAQFLPVENMRRVEFFGDKI